MLFVWEMVSGWVLSVVIVTGNGLVIYLITTRQNLRTTTNWFVLSLAVADFDFGAISFPLYSFCYYQSCPTKVGYVAYSTWVFLMYASVTNLCALTLDRYLAIVKPLRYVTFMTKKHVALLIFVAWGIASLILIYFLVVLSLALPVKMQEIMFKIISLCTAVLCFSACVFLLFATARIFLIIRRIARQNAAVVAQLNFNHRIQHRVAFKARETATAKMVGIVVTIFVICYSLDILEIILFYFGSSFQFNKTWFSIRKLLRLTNSAVNPVAYAFHKRDIKRELKRLFRCNKKQVPHSNSVTIREQSGQYQLRVRQNQMEQQSGS